MQFLNCNLFFINILSFLWFPVLFFSFKSLFLFFAFFLVFSYVFVEHQCFWFQKTQVKKHQFLVKRGVATKRFFLINCVLKNVKSYRFLLAPFLAKFWLMFKNTVKIGISANFQKQK